MSGVIILKDWRLNGQERYLDKVTLKHIKYSNRIFNKPNWDHDHCEFCFEKISNCENDLNEAYCTEDEYHWICDNCYTDFKNLFHWKVI